MSDQERKEKALAEEILADARRQADRKLASARRAAEAALRSARARTGAIEQEAFAAADRTIERETRTILADIPHQEQVRRLRVMEELVSRQFHDALDILRARAPRALLPSLVRLTVDAIALMDGDRFAIEVAPRDADRLGTDLAEQARSEVRKRAGRGVAIDVVPSSALADGGVIVRSAHGRLMVDNSFATRMRRAHEGLRGQVARILFGDSPE